MATIKDIAREAGVSIGTVDRVLHDRGMVSPETVSYTHLDVYKRQDFFPFCRYVRDMPRN